MNLVCVDRDVAGGVLLLGGGCQAGSTQLEVHGALCDRRV
jgi:hypothetical protein